MEKGEQCDCGTVQVNEPNKHSSKTDLTSQHSTDASGGNVFSNLCRGVPLGPDSLQLSERSC